MAPLMVRLSSGATIEFHSPEGNVGKYTASSPTVLIIIISSINIIIIIVFNIIAAVVVIIGIIFHLHKQIYWNGINGAVKNKREGGYNNKIKRTIKRGKVKHTLRCHSERDHIFPFCCIVQ